MSNITGFDKLSEKLKRMSNGLKELEGEHTIPLPDLLSPDFIRANSRFKDVNELFEASGFKIESAEDFAAIPDHEWDAHISSSTSFSSWHEMQKAAVTEMVKKKMGL